MAKALGYIINEGQTVESEANIISDRGDRVLAEGRLQDLDVRNRNGRIYETKEIKPEINGPRMKELLDAGQFKGEAGHPVGADAQDLSRQQTIDPKYTCVRFTKIWLEGNIVMGQFKGTNNDLGDYFNKDLLEGCKPAFSLRALGSIETRGGNMYVKNVRIITWDHVIYPSHKVAYTQRLVTESAGSKPVSLIEQEITKRRAYSTNEAGLLVPIMNEDVASFIKQESANIKSIMETFDVLYESMKLIDNGTRVQLVDREGDTLIINLEDKIRRDIYSYC